MDVLVIGVCVGIAVEVGTFHLDRTPAGLPSLHRRRRWDHTSTSDTNESSARDREGGQRRHCVRGGQTGRRGDPVEQVTRPAQRPDRRVQLGPEPLQVDRLQPGLAHPGEGELPRVAEREACSRILTASSRALVCSSNASSTSCGGRCPKAPCGRSLTCQLTDFRGSHPTWAMHFLRPRRLTGPVLNRPGMTSRWHRAGWCGWIPARMPPRRRHRSPGRAACPSSTAGCCRSGPHGAPPKAIRPGTPPKGMIPPPRAALEQLHTGKPGRLAVEGHQMLRPGPPACGCNHQIRETETLIAVGMKHRTDNVTGLDLKFGRSQHPLQRGGDPGPAAAEADLRRNEPGPHWKAVASHPDCPARRRHARDGRPCQGAGLPDGPWVPHAGARCSSVAGLGWNWTFAAHCRTG